MKIIILFSKLTTVFETKVNFHDLRCDAFMMSPTDLRTLCKYILEYSFRFKLVQEVSIFVKKHGS